jgi:hypothetical protein
MILSTHRLPKLRLQPHEWITASAIYYYERDDSIEDAGVYTGSSASCAEPVPFWPGLYLRRKRDGEDFPDVDEHHRDVCAQR